MVQTSRNKMRKVWDLTYGMKNGDEMRERDVHVAGLSMHPVKPIPI